MRALKALVKVLLGLSLGLLLAEGAFWLRDRGAFPHLNLYLPDERLGVRLWPHTEMKLRVADNAVTSVRINKEGFRGADWPEPSPSEVLVVGDSQVFGLGVEEGETFSAQLTEKLKRPVLNAGVPTYGPREYTAVVESLIQQRKIGTVVYVLNLSNDLFEVDRPNVQRHTVWDGWAVRAETAPAPGETRDFPFRRELMSQSHLVFALRQLISSTAKPVTEGFSTEGTWKDVVQASAGVTPPPPEDAAARTLLTARSALDTQLGDVARALESHFQDKVNDDPAFAAAVKPLVPRGGDARDIVQVTYAEGARPVDRTAYHLFMAALGEGRNEVFLEELAKKRKDPALTKLLEERRALRGKLDALKPPGEAAHALPIDVVLAKTKAACDAVGARLLVVALPLDVMVSADEWQKYGVAPLDMTPTRVLVEDVVARAERLGAVGLDPTSALLAAEPGAFLHADLHLTAKGHAALAGSIVEALNRPVKPRSTLELPADRSWPPTDDEWRRQDECTVKGSTAAGCETKLVREWLRVRCLPKPAPGDDYGDVKPEVIELIRGGHGDWRAWADEAATLIIPVVPGDSARVRFAWNQVDRELTLEFPRDGKLEMAFSSPRKRVKRPVEEQLSYRAPLVGDPLAPPSCPAGQRAAGSLLRCAPSCVDDAGCHVGHCEAWPGGGFCAVP